MFEGTHFFKHFVKVNQSEPDPRGYIRHIDSIKVKIVKPELYAFEDGDCVYLLTEIKSRSFLWH